MSSMDERMQDKLFMLTTAVVLLLVFGCGVLVGLMW